MSPKFSNKENLPLSLAVFLAHDEYPHAQDVMRISVTSLLKPIKAIILGKRVPKGSGQTDITTRMASVYGTAMHNHLERAWCSEALPETLRNLGYPPGAIKCIRVNPTEDELAKAEAEGEDIIPVYTEFRTEKTLDGYTITGEFDFLADGKIRDLKTTGTYSYISRTKDEDYRLQGSMYRWLNPKKVTDDIMSIDYIFTDWSSLSARTQDGYPPTRMTSRDFEMLSINDTERFIKDKLQLITMFKDAEEKDIPSCTNEDLWVNASKYKYYKNPENAKRATKVYDTLSEANAHLYRDGSVGVVIEFKDDIKACIYCEALPICEQALEYINTGELKL